MMRQGKWIIYIFTIAFLAIAVFCGRMDPPIFLGASESLEELDFSIVIKLETESEQIDFWKSEEDTYFAFLPSYAKLNQIYFRGDQASSVQFNGVTVLDEMTCDNIELGKRYPLTYLDENQNRIQTSITFLQSAQLPTVHVDVRSGNMEYIHQTKGNEEPGSMRIYASDGTLEYSGNLEAVKGRGNATWEEEKKPYSLTLRAGADILGMGQAKKWILLPNCMDPTNIRNKAVYDLARKVGLSYSPDSQWVDLYLNGTYAGLYLLCEKVEVHSQRVDITSENGFLVSREKTDRVWVQDLPHITTSSGVCLRIHHSNGDSGQLQKIWQMVENAILAEDGTDPETGQYWLDLIDLDSWAKKYLIEEIFGNLDAGAISQYFYSDGEKIFAGPVWDYDMSMGNTDTWQIDTPNMLYAGRPHLWNAEDEPWFYALYQKEEFRERVAELYGDLFRPALWKLLEQDMETYISEIKQASFLNQLRWSQQDPMDAVERMREYMLQRMEFLDSVFLETEEYHLVQFWINEHIIACYAIPDGGTVSRKEVPAGTDVIVYEGWYDAASDMLFNFEEPVTEDKFVYLREINLNEKRLGVEVQGGLTSAIKYIPSVALLFLLTGGFAGDCLRRRKQRKLESLEMKRGVETET